jgi:uncharacterized protein YegL
MRDNVIPDVVFIDNTSQRLPCVLVIDGSGSMTGSPIDELNAGLKILEEELKLDDIASQRVQLMVILYGGDNEVEILTQWTDAMAFSAPNLTANGLSPLGAAVDVALKEIESQKARYRANGIAYNRPWLFLLTDGAPTDNDWHRHALQSRDAEQAGKVICFGIGVGDAADLEKLAKFSIRQPVRLRGLKFRELFLWLSRSTSTASRAAQGSTVQLPPPTDWMEVSA